MKVNKWTYGLAAAGVVSLASVAQAGDANETVMTAVSSTTLSGYVSVTANWNPGSGNGAGGVAPTPGQTFRGGTAAAQDAFAVDVFSVSISKPLGENEWAAGYNAQLWFAETSGAGAAPSIGSFAGGVQLKNANIDLRVPVGNGLDLKVGIFDSIIGYESSDYNANPNYSRGYGWGIEPTTHEGVLASYRVNEILSVSAGIANSYGVTAGGLATGTFAGAQAESQKAYMASLALTAPDSAGFLAGGSLYAGVVNGMPAGANTADVTSLYVGATIPTPVEGLAAGIGWDYRLNNGANVNSAAFTLGAGWATALAGYLSYDVTEKVAVHYRIDWAQGSNGSFGYLRAAGDDEHQNKLLSNTLTLDYKAWENVISRLELRWDHALDGNKIYGGDATSDADRNDFKVAANFIYQF